MFVMGVAIIGLAAALGVIGYVLNVAASTPPISELKKQKKGTSSSIYAADGTRLGFIQADTFRTPVRFDEMPDDVKDATVAIEDERFYKHNGVDYEGIARATWRNVREGEAVEGGSTITQQLVRNMYISSQRTLERKIREAKLAVELEKRRTKKQILHEYLNSVSYGTLGGVTVVGVEAAGQMLFSKPAKDLDLEESALLAGLTQAPSLYDPFVNPSAATRRRNEVLFSMARLGYISRHRAREASRAPLGLNRGDYYTRIREPFFFDYVKDELIQRYGVSTVREGGLKIYTTIDPRLQAYGRQAIDSILNWTGDPSAAVVAVDPTNGHIKAMSSSGTYEHSQFNLAGQGHRQPGSAFKPFALATAVLRGVDPGDTFYESKRVSLPVEGYGYWKVNNYDESAGGKMSLERATLRSDNTIYAQLAMDLGADKVAETAKKMGIETKLDGVPSETLGGLTLGVSPLEMASAYGTLADGGVHVKPIAITKVVFPRGKVDRPRKSGGRRAMTAGEAEVITDILEKNISSGTGRSASIGCPAAGKTGTTDNFNDAWFVGYTPKLSTSVWIGYPNALREMRSVHGISVAGGTLPAEIWREFMSVARRGYCSDFEPAYDRPYLTRFYGRYALRGEIDEKDEERKRKLRLQGIDPETAPPSAEGGIDRNPYAADPTGQYGE